MKLLITFLVILSSSVCLANGDWFYKGNGGFVLNCPELPLQTFDLYELSARYHSTLDESELHSLNSRVNFLISRLKHLSPQRAEQYRRWFAIFFLEANFVKDVNFHPVPDLGKAIFPSVCLLELAIFQRNPTPATPQRYTINSALWNRLDIKNKAALILHELIYREASSKENQHKTSESTRFLTAWLNAEGFESVSLKDFLLKLQQLHFQLGEAHGYTLSLGQYNETRQKWEQNDLLFHPRGWIEAAYYKDIYKEAPRLFPSFLQNFCSLSIRTSPFPGLLYFDKKGNIIDWIVNTNRYTHCFNSFETTDFNAVQEVIQLQTGPDNTYLTSGYFDDQQVLTLGGYRLIMSGGGVQLIGSVKQDAEGHFIELFLSGHSCRHQEAKTIIVRRYSIVRDPDPPFTVGNIAARFDKLPACY